MTISNPASTSHGFEVRLLGNDAGLFSLPTPAPTTTGPMSSTPVLATAGNPLVLQVADGTDERTLTVRFTATDDGSGLGVQDRFAVISFTSNDPVVGDGAVNPARLTLVARATW